MRAVFASGVNKWCLCANVQNLKTVFCDVLAEEDDDEAVAVSDAAEPSVS